MSPEARDHSCQGDSWIYVRGETFCGECGRTLDEIEADKINAAVTAAEEREGV